MRRWRSVIYLQKCAAVALKRYLIRRAALKQVGLLSRVCIIPLNRILVEKQLTSKWVIYSLNYRKIHLFESYLKQSYRTCILTSRKIFPNEIKREITWKVTVLSLDISIWILRKEGVRIWNCRKRFCLTWLTTKRKILAIFSESFSLLTEPPFLWILSTIAYETKMTQEVHH